MDQTVGLITDYSAEIIQSTKELMQLEGKPINMNNNIRTFSLDEDLVKERRENIRKKATALFAKQPFDRTNITQLLKYLGMSKGALYHYVGSKEDIRTLIIEYMATVYLEVHRGLRVKIENMTPVEALREYIRFICEYFDLIQDETIVITHEIGNLTRAEREPHFNSERSNIAFLAEILEEGVETGDFQIDDIKLAAHSIYLATHAWADRRWYLRRLYSLEEYIQSVTQFALKAVGTKTN